MLFQKPTVRKLFKFTFCFESQKPLFFRKGIFGNGRQWSYRESRVLPPKKFQWENNLNCLLPTFLFEEDTSKVKLKKIKVAGTNHQSVQRRKIGENFSAPGVLSSKMFAAPIHILFPTSNAMHGKFPAALQCVGEIVKMFVQLAKVKMLMQQNGNYILRTSTFQVWHEPLKPICIGWTIIHLKKQRPK